MNIRRLDGLYNMTDKKFDVEVMGYSISATGIITFPGGTLVIDSEGFAKIEASAIVINDGCKILKSKAFANSGINAIIPDSVTAIASNACDGCRPLNPVAQGVRMQNLLVRLVRNRSVR